jgi:hypothetical protein
MGADAGNLDHGTLGRKSGRSRGGLERFRNVAAGRLADGTAALADEEDDEIVAAVIMQQATKALRLSMRWTRPLSRRKSSAR